MAFSGLIPFIEKLEKNKELLRIKSFVDPVLEITEVTDRVTKSKGKALLFENNGTSFPVLINAFGSDKRLSMALGRENLEEAAKEIEGLFNSLTGSRTGLFEKLSSVPELMRVAGIMPSRSSSRGSCQAVVHRDPDLSILPVLKCWPYDGGRFITLPMVHTIHPDSGRTNLGMYRMQIIDSKTTGMHWQRHKTGANHFEAWKKSGRKMPVTVTLGGDPVYTYAATAPLPENISEYILAGFLRKKKVKLVKCLTNDLYVPEDADIVIEGYVDPSEELFFEGPFGDHTGFYSLADYYPKFHVTCITHSEKAIYPATIVGIPPMEDAFFAKASEKIFLAPVKMAMLPEIEDFHMPDAGTAHNLLIVRIKKSYPGQGLKVISSISGTGQLMFSKYIIVVDGDTDIRDYRQLARAILSNTDPGRDIMFLKGPLDVLDHASDTMSFGGKAGIDATVKTGEELQGRTDNNIEMKPVSTIIRKLTEEGWLLNSSNADNGIHLLTVAVDPSGSAYDITRLKLVLKDIAAGAATFLILAVDRNVDISDNFLVAWQVLANSDPKRDHEIFGNGLLIDGTIKVFRQGGFPRKWPNAVCSDEKTITDIDKKWNLLGISEELITSPSVKNRKLIRNGTDSIEV